MGGGLAAGRRAGGPAGTLGEPARRSAPPGAQLIYPLSIGGAPPAGPAGPTRPTRPLRRPGRTAKFRTCPENYHPNATCG